MFILLVMALLQTPEIRERYECHGATSQGAYDISLEITREGENLSLYWIRPQGIQARGRGLVSGEQLIAVFVNDREQFGMISYRITKGGLEGVWFSGSGMQFFENCAVGKMILADEAPSP